jgi:DNA-directed RNA polymerase subunit RPC12/RpoP
MVKVFKSKLFKNNLEDNIGEDINYKEQSNKNKDLKSQCPYCGSKAQRKGTYYYFLQGFLLVPVSSLMGIFFLPVLIGIPIGIIMMIIAPFIEKGYKCNNCKHEWKD